MTSIGASRPGVIGRDDDLAAGDRFLDVLDGGSATLVLEGEPGIGKTTVWSEISSACAGTRSHGHDLATGPVRDRAPLRRSARPDRRAPRPARRAPGSATSRAGDRTDAHRTGAQRDGSQHRGLCRFPFVAHQDVDGIAGRHRDRRPAVARCSHLSGGLVRGSATWIAARRSTRLRPRPVGPRPRSPSGRHRGRG